MPQRGEPGCGDPQLAFLRALLRRPARRRRRLDRDERRQCPSSAQTGDAHQILLDIVGLHPSSVEYYSRYAESLSELFNIVNLWGFGPDFCAAP